MRKRKVAGNVKSYSFQVITFVLTLRLKKIIMEMKISLPLYITTCSLMNLCQGFEVIFCFLLQVRELSLTRKTVTFLEKVSHWLASPTVTEVRS
jgi:hypothetical protein